MKLAKSEPRGPTRALTILTLGLACLLGAAFQARAQLPGQSSGSLGKHLYKEHCASCHKWNGSGGGGYGGAAASLRASHLDQSQMVKIVSCGIPGSGMPYHLRDAYTKAHPCYGLTNRKSLGKNAPLQPAQFLRSSEIRQIVNYVQTTIQGRGETTYAECRAFFGAHTRACDNYPKVASKPGTASSKK